MTRAFFYRVRKLGKLVTVCDPSIQRFAPNPVFCAATSTAPFERSVFGVLPNDYAHLKAAMMESRLASPDSPFAEACRALARKLGGLPEAPPERFKLALLRKLGRIAG
jgi:hypothetical protein